MKKNAAISAAFFLSLGLFTLFQPIIDEPAGDGGFVGDGWHIVACEPAALAEFFLLQVNFSSGVVCRETYHQSERVGPWL